MRVYPIWYVWLVVYVWSLHGNIIEDRRRHTHYIGNNFAQVY